MDIWQVTSDERAGTYTHTLSADSGHALLVWSASSIFQALRVSAAVNDGNFWWSIHAEPSAMSFETELGVETERWSYNARQFAKVSRTRVAHRAEHAGLSDFFVPIVKRGSVAAVLVVGPFRTQYPTSAELQKRFFRMSGRQGHPADPVFSAYLRATLSTLALEGPLASCFGEFLGCFAKLVAGEGRADEIANRAHVLRAQLEPARLVERSWEKVRDMLGDRFSRSHYRASVAQEFLEIGLGTAPDNALVGLAASRKQNADPIDSMLRRDAFQRRMVEVARATGAAIAGQVGEHGVVLFSSTKGNATEQRKALLLLSQRAGSIAGKEFGLTVHFGACLGTHASPLFQTYQTALLAAETSVAEGRTFTLGDAKRAPGDALRKQREALYLAVDQEPSTLSARFERYLEAVALHTSHQLERGHRELEICFEHLTLELLKQGTLNKKSFEALRDKLDRATTEARNAAELFLAYRSAAAEVEHAVLSPVAARQDRSLRGALDYIAQHYAKALSLNEVARAAGFAPKYFSRLFHEHEGVTFAKYLATLRLERAKELLSGTEQSVTRVSELAGFHTPQYFCRVFVDKIGLTPLEYRQKLHPRRRLKSIKRKLPKYKIRPRRAR